MTPMANLEEGSADAEAEVDELLPVAVSEEAGPVDTLAAHTGEPIEDLPAALPPEATTTRIPFWRASLHPMKRAFSAPGDEHIAAPQLRDGRDARARGASA